MRSFVEVSVPATSANLGPGFDVLGLALALYNRFTFAWSDSGKDELLAPTVAELGRVNLATLGLFQALDRAWQAVHPETPRPPICVTLTQAEIPLARGLGSSASAVVAGLIGLNALADLKLSMAQMAMIACQIEGHADNVLAALYGGLVMCLDGQGDVDPVFLPWPEHWQPIVIIPESRVSTEKARSALPQDVSRQDAVFNLSRLGAWVSAAYTGDDDHLRLAMADRLHEPVRSQWIEGFDAYHHTALASGALGLVISGSGPTMLAIASSPENSGTTGRVASALETCAQDLNQPETRVLKLSVDTLGAHVQGWA